MMMSVCLAMLGRSLVGGLEGRCKHRSSDRVEVLAQRQERHGDRHAGGERQHDARSGDREARDTYGVQRQVLGDACHERRAGGLGLRGSNVAAAADAVRHVVVAASHHRAVHAALALADADVGGVGVAVELGGLEQEELDRQLVPAFRRQSALLEQPLDGVRALQRCASRLLDVALADDGFGECRERVLLLLRCCHEDAGEEAMRE